MQNVLAAWKNFAYSHFFFSWGKNRILVRSWRQLLSTKPSNFWCRQRSRVLLCAYSEGMTRISLHKLWEERFWSLARVLIKFSDWWNRLRAVSFLQLLRSAKKLCCFQLYSVFFKLFMLGRAKRWKRLAETCPKVPCQKIYVWFLTGF